MMNKHKCMKFFHVFHMIVETLKHIVVVSFYKISFICFTSSYTLEDQNGITITENGMKQNNELHVQSFQRNNIIPGSCFDDFLLFLLLFIF